MAPRIVYSDSDSASGPSSDTDSSASDEEKPCVSPAPAPALTANPRVDRTAGIRLSTALDKLKWASQKPTDLNNDRDTCQMLQTLFASEASSNGTTLDMAKKETNRGLKAKAGPKLEKGLGKLTASMKRKSSTSTSTSTSKSKGKKKEGRKEKLKSTMFKVGTVAILPHGTQRVKSEDHDALLELGLPIPKYTLPMDGFPDTLMLEHLKQMSLAVINKVKGVEFGLHWEHNEVEEHLQNLFPALFGHLDILALETNYDEDSDLPYNAQWMLCCKRQRKAHVTGIPHANGLDLDRHSQRTQQTGFRNWTILLTTRHAVPKSTLTILSKGKGRAQIQSASSVAGSSSSATAASFATASSATASSSKKRKFSSEESPPLFDHDSDYESPPRPKRLKIKTYRTRASSQRKNSRKAGPSTSASGVGSSAAPIALDLTDVEDDGDRLDISTLSMIAARISSSSFFHYSSTSKTVKYDVLIQD
ncbi:hypothetical protein LshimejAT787_2700060 [Lyophyllum shimeji]|uniref:Uncharacterized protein n=1 Tax=Lyophyllum shimeji TaxID=47721 RepID=A0A9P3Q300_LYOSH|nr:hypothetical protein LshimejAT787_2700060 [Lyophyllum shimeji]